MTARVSVLIPNRNYAHTLPEALTSLTAQTFQDFEILAADDGSEDDSLQVLDKWLPVFGDRLRILRHPEGKARGLAATYRLAADAARGEILAFLEADDAWEPGNLEEKIRVLDTFPQAGVVFSSFRPFGDPGGSLFWRIYAALIRMETPKHRPFNALPYFLRRNAAATFSAFLVRRSLFEAVPAPDPTELYFDWWALAHLSVMTSFYYMPEKSVRWRIHRHSAAYGPVNIQTLERLNLFFERLCTSLSHHTEDADRSIIQDARERIRALTSRTPGATFWSAPLQTSRFIAHRLLKSCLMPGGL